MYAFAQELWPICRSLTGAGVRRTLALIKERLPGLEIHEVSSGTKAFGWEVPPEWNISEAYLLDPLGKKVVDFKDSNLHVVGYSEPIDRELTLEELRPHLFSLPDQPDAIPYVTSYYKKNWGFCLTHRRLAKLKSGRYRAVIKSTLRPGQMTYADLVLPGKTDRELFFSTYVCHPSLANNELSGPVVTTALAQWAMSLKERRYTYRFYFGPETIGAIVYLSRHLQHLKAKLDAGWVVTCVGDDRKHTFLASRRGGTLADRVTRHVLGAMVPGYDDRNFLHRGSDERQYCSPGADLPVVSAMRTRYGDYPEYHTSLDDLSVISPRGLDGALAVLKACAHVTERNRTYEVEMPCEPQLGKHGLYPETSSKVDYEQIRAMKDLLAYCDGRSDLLSIAGLIGRDFLELAPIAEKLQNTDIIRETPETR